MKFTRLIPYLFSILVLFVACEDNDNDSDDDAAEAREEAMTGEVDENYETANANTDVDMDELWDNEKSQEFVTENARTHLRIVEIARAGQNAGFGDRINAITSKALQGSEGAYNNLKQVAAGMNVTLMEALSQEEIEDLDMEKFGNGEKDDIGEDYLEALIKEYKDLIDDYEDAAEKGATESVRNHAAGILQNLEAELAEIEALEKEID